MQLFAPREYWTAKDRDRVCNGCGAKGIVGLLIPETIFGLRVTPACDIHDWMYVHGRTVADKEEADRVFLNNMLRIIEARPGRFLQWLRCRRAITYYLAVRDFGGPAFWQGKNKAGEMMAVA